MGLNFGIKDNLFPHSQKFETGLGKVRAGQATIIVAQDGSGDTDSIQEGVNLLPSGGGVVYIKEGNYILSTSITIDKSNVSLTGAGKSTIITLNADAPIITAVSKDYITIENMFLQGSNNAAYTTNDGVYLYEGDYCILSHLWINQTGRYGINFRYSGASIITENFVTNSKSDGIYVYDLWESVVSNNIVHDNGGEGIHIRDGTDSIIESNMIEGSTLNGLKIAQTGYTVINNNACYSNTQSGIYNYVSLYCTMNGNICRGNTRHGIHCYQGDYNSITGNVCIANDVANSASYDGIILEEVWYTTISANRCAENDRYEINNSDAWCDRNIIMNNICYGADHVGAINDSGTNTYPNGASGTTNLALDDLNIIA